MRDKYTMMFQLQYRYLHHGFSTINTETSLILVAAITVIVIVVTVMITGIPNPTPSPMLELCDLQLGLHKELHPLQLQLLSKLHPLLLHLHHLLQLRALSMLIRLPELQYCLCQFLNRTSPSLLLSSCPQCPSSYPPGIGIRIQIHLPPNPQPLPLVKIHWETIRRGWRCLSRRA
ncbi:hypothetical protein PanWU01x14_261690 [Parasponia andersonii]|uniref:Transmembrane protein n=1 Tax=Parasponia andersonii TaxID=3476 RepID=A0A2P5B8N1_PARAD|nr:hypothetical protein PanWU01x14_261690 [Parasponia andersonii]